MTEERNAALAAFTEAVAGREWQEFEWLVKAAYSAGASRDDLIAAAEAGRRFADVPERLVALAYATVNAWRWMAARGPAPLRVPISTPMKQRLPAPPYRGGGQGRCASPPCSSWRG